MLHAVLEIVPYTREGQYVLAEIDTLTPDVIVYRPIGGTGENMIIARQYVSAIFPVTYMVARKVRFSVSLRDYVWEVLQESHGFPRQFTDKAQAQKYIDNYLYLADGGTESGWKVVTAVQSTEIDTVKVLAL